MIKKISRKMLASKACKNWKETYCPTGIFKIDNCFDKEKTYKKILSLGKNPDPKDVNNAIGNSTWTDVQCDSCEKYVDMAVIIGQPVDYESSTTTACIDCLKKSIEIIERHK